MKKNQGKKNSKASKVLLTVSGAFFFFHSEGELLDVDEWGECASLSDISSSAFFFFTR
jgi:hypothetical protein